MFLADLKKNTPDFYSTCNFVNTPACVEIWKGWLFVSHEKYFHSLYAGQ
jgi:hypothetical protein